MNGLMAAWCVRPGHQIVLTRSRVCKSKDRAWVEQKNEMLVCRVVGLARGRSLRGPAPIPLARKPYGCTNLFRPSFTQKQQTGWWQAQGTLQRLLATEEVSQERSAAACLPASDGACWSVISLNVFVVMKASARKGQRFCAPIMVRRYASLLWRQNWLNLEWLIPSPSQG